VAVLRPSIWRNQLISGFELAQIWSAMARAIVLGALVIAAWLPRARAARTDPASALRAE
jgi:ABC-type lipoprotein release transport system permease subunit